MTRDPRSARPAHMVRPAKRVRAATASQEPAEYAPGYFTHLIRRHDWPPRFEPQMQAERKNEAGETAREVAVRVRDDGLRAGKWHAIGTLPIGSGKRDAKPVGWM